MEQGMTVDHWVAVIGLVVGLVGACFSALASVIAYFVKKGEDAQDQNIDELKTDHSAIRSDVETIKRTLAQYETHIGAGDQRLEEIRNSIAEHVTREEQIFWKKVEAISDAQKIFAEAVLQRIAAMEAKMPNGEIKEIVQSLARLEATVAANSKASQEAHQHLIEHNKEAEDWKQRIVALEAARDKKRMVRGKK